MTGAMPTARWQLPRLDRRNRWIGGVAAAIATEIGVQPTIIRVSFVVLTTVGGWGLVLYAVAWAILAIGTPSQISPYSPVPKGATSTHRHVGVAMVVLGLVLGFLPLTSELFRNLVFPVGFVLTGALIAWSRGQREQEGISIVVRVIAGLVVAVGGLIAFAALQFNLIDTLVSLVFGLAVLAGISVVAAPSVIRMAQDLDGERLGRIRSDERARISAHLHDSVLQTLSLIQKNAEDPARTVQLARQQERELRNWLYGTTPDNPHAIRLGPALEDTATRIERDHGVTIDVVAVGDNDDHAPEVLAPLLAAAGEAMANAAEHSGVDRIDVFAERRGDTIEVFVRDTGVGFDTAQVSTDRKGLAESIHARMARAGGRAHVHSAPGDGTEIELVLPLAAAHRSPGGLS